LVWDDFIGRTQACRANSGIDCIWLLGYKASSKSGSDGTEINIECIAISKPDSWVVKGHDNAHVSLMSNGHFDITYIIVLNLSERIKQRKDHTPNIINTLSSQRFIKSVMHDCNASMP
jgi:hypothetical protein